MRGLLAPAVVLALACSVPLAAMPEDAKGALDRARAALARGDGIAAEADLKRAQDAGASRTEVAAAMGEAMLIQGQLDKARDWLGPGSFAKGQEAYGWRMRGLLERREGRLTDAGKAYDQAMRFNPRDAQVWVDIGRLRYIGGEHLQALEASEQAVAVGPKHAQALEFRAEIIRDSAGWEAALPFYARAIEMEPDNVRLLGGYAVSLGEAGRTREMLEICRRILAKAPRSPLPFQLQAVLAARAGNVELARAMLNRVGEAERQTPAGLLLTGVLELEAGNPELAIVPLDQLARLQPANQRAQLLLARAYHDAGADDLLLDRFLESGQRVDAPAYLLTLLGRALEERGDRQAAAAFLDRAAQSTLLPLAGIASTGRAGTVPANAVQAAQQVRWGIALDNFPNAAKVADEFLSAHSGSAEALGLAGDGQLALGNYPLALDHYLSASRVRFPELLLQRINETYAQANRAMEGQALTSRYLSAYPRSLLAARMAADYAMHSGDWARTQSLLSAVRARGANRDARLLADIAIAQIESGDAKSALATAERAWKLQPASLAVTRAYARALARQGGNKELARQIELQAQQLGGGPQAIAGTNSKARSRRLISIAPRQGRIAA